ncbi:unnamed protein product [Prunus armeniaca]|uniref:Uncharacterized protein n=1 Tax=Prunus armeniaca TaxID=36596 RepID=A0A6J5XWI3_PRUAR|nr:unnamed protein product [Prunus armeniaca]
MLAISPCERLIGLSPVCMEKAHLSPTAPAPRIAKNVRLRLPGQYCEERSHQDLGLRWVNVYCCSPRTNLAENSLELLIAHRALALSKEVEIRQALLSVLLHCFKVHEWEHCASFTFCSKSSDVSTSNNAGNFAEIGRRLLQHLEYCNSYWDMPRIGCKDYWGCHLLVQSSHLQRARWSNDCLKAIIIMIQMLLSGSVHKLSPSQGV